MSPISSSSSSLLLMIFYQCFTSAALSFCPLPLFACYWQIYLPLMGTPTVSAGTFHVSFTQGDYSPCVCRWGKLTTQLVLQRTIRLLDFTSHIFKKPAQAEHTSRNSYCRRSGSHCRSTVSMH